MSTQLVTVVVAEPEPDARGELEDMVDELAHMAHDAAEAEWRAAEGTPHGCSFQWFAAEVPDRTRAVFIAAQRKLNVGEADLADHLAEWDRFVRPFAIVHVIRP